MASHNQQSPGEASNSASNQNPSTPSLELFYRFRNADYLASDLSIQQRQADLQALQKECHDFMQASEQKLRNHQHFVAWMEHVRQNQQAYVVLSREAFGPTDRAKFVASVVSIMRMLPLETRAVDLDYQVHASTERAFAKAMGNVELALRLKMRAETDVGELHEIEELQDGIRWINYGIETRIVREISDRIQGLRSEIEQLGGAQVCADVGAYFERINRGAGWNSS